MWKQAWRSSKLPPLKVHSGVTTSKSTCQHHSIWTLPSAYIAHSHSAAVMNCNSSHLGAKKQGGQREMCKEREQFFTCRRTGLKFVVHWQTIIITVGHQVWAWKTEVKIRAQFCPRISQSGFKRESRVLTQHHVYILGGNFSPKGTYKGHGVI